jgi:dolichol kinase
MSETGHPTLVGDAHTPRKVMHFLSAAIIPLLYHLTIMPDRWAVATVASIAVVWVGFETIRLASPALNRMFVRLFSVLMKEKETRTFTGVAYLLGGSAIAMMIFPKPVAVMALFFIAFGDPVAAIVGKRLGRWRLASGKSVEGSLMMFAVCLAVGGAVGGDVPFLVVVVGGAVATLAELFSGGIDDNLTAPLLAGAAMTALML